ncbi:MAG: D-hexose-6-phosphate mutarotase [Variovorax sp.]
MTTTCVDFHGQPVLRMRLPSGDQCTVALHGAQVLSWITADGRERFYLSDRALLDGKSAIRGGAPVCWPQFNERGALPKHGFVRNVAWHMSQGKSVPDAPGAQVLQLSLDDGLKTREIWPHKFALRLSVTLAPSRLRIALEAHNTDREPWSFTTALHSYLRVDDIAAARLAGLEGREAWDALRDTRQVQAAEALGFDAQFDSVFSGPATSLELRQGSGVVRIAQSESFGETVVWNPGAALAAELADLPDDDYRHMLCVEAAAIDTPVLLAPGSRWQGWQELRTN